MYLEVVPERRLVLTDAYTAGWVPAEKPFFTADRDDGGRSGTAPATSRRARHWRDEDLKAHEEMGFHEGWGQTADQLEAVAQSAQPDDSLTGGHVMTDRIIPCLWFNDNAEEAINFYVSLVPNSRII